MVIAAALAQIAIGRRPAPAPLLLLDEPTAALDLAYQLEIASLLRELRATAAAVDRALDARPELRREPVLVARAAQGRTRACGRPDRARPDRARACASSTASTPTCASTTRPGISSSRRSAARTPGTRRRDAGRSAGSSLTSLLGFGGLALATIVAAPLVGSTPISLRRAFDPSLPFADNVDAQIFFVARLPRTLAGALVGGALAAAGVVFQGLLRNPLATPFTLGVSSGAALGAMLAITFGWTLGGLGLPAIPVASFVGSLGAVGIVYALARARHGGLSTNTLLLAGVTMNAFFSALILFVQYFADFAETYRTLRWLMGDLDVSAYQPLVAALPLLVVSFALFAWLARPLNLLSLGADSAETHGVDVTPRAARRLLQRVAGDRRGRVGGRPDRLHRHHRPAPGPADGRRGSPRRAAGLGAVRRGVPGRLRHPGAHDHGAGRAAGRRHHRAHRRTVLPVAADQGGVDFDGLGARGSGRDRESSGVGVDQAPDAHGRSYVEVERSRRRRSPDLATSEPDLQVGALSRWQLLASLDLSRLDGTLRPMKRFLTVVAVAARSASCRRRSRRRGRSASSR